MSDLTAINPDLILKPSKRARRITLRLDTQTRKMILVMPERASLKKAQAFATDHVDWIRQKLLELPDPVPFQDGTVFPLYGRDITIKINFDNTLKITAITRHKDELHISTNKGDPSGRIIRFLKKDARKTLESLAREKAAKAGKPLKTVQIRDSRGRWGSCGPDGRMSLSWRLILGPYAAMDYVVAHETAHLIHMNHGKKFWALCEKLSADYDTGKHWMRTQGHTLMRYGISESSSEEHESPIRAHTPDNSPF